MMFQCKYSENVYDAGLQSAERRQEDEQVGQEANVKAGESGVYFFLSAWPFFSNKLSKAGGVERLQGHVCTLTFAYGLGCHDTYPSIN